MKRLGIHPLANLFPLMTIPEFQGLVADIRSNGLKEPIWTHQGKIIDGRNRYRACQTLGIKPRLREWDGKGSLVGFIVSMNLARRHLTSSQKAVVALEIERELAKESRKRVGRPAKNSAKICTFSGKARDNAALIVGTNRTYVSAAKRIAADAPELILQIKDGLLTVADARRLVKINKAERKAILGLLEAGRVKTLKDARALVRREQKLRLVRKAASASDRYRLIHDDVESLERYVKPQSLDCIITDPPFSDLDAHRHLAEQAAKVLKPGGSLLVVANRVLLPKIMKLMEVEGLNWHWLLAIVQPGGCGKIWQKRINPGWVPVLHYTKGKYQGTWARDIIVSEAPDKGHHEWGRNPQVFAQLIESYSEPGGLICDPFLGGGGCAIAAIQTGRRFIGVDINASAVAVTRRRLATLAVTA